MKFRNETSPPRGIGPKWCESVLPFSPGYAVSTPCIAAPSTFQTTARNFTCYPGAPLQEPEGRGGGGFLLWPLGWWDFDTGKSRSANKSVEEANKDSDGLALI